MDLSIYKTAGMFQKIVSPQITQADIGGVNVEHAYIVQALNQKYILKTVRDDHVRQVAQAAAITEALFANGFHLTTQNIKTINNEYIYKDSEGVNWEMQKYIEGIQIAGNKLQDKNLHSLASTIASLHTAFGDINQPDELELEPEVSYISMFDGEQHTKTTEALEQLVDKKLPEKDLTLINKYWKKYQTARTEILDMLQKVSEDTLQKGIIHRDLNKGNILFEPNGPNVAAIVDWDTVAWGNILQDIAYLCSHYLLLEKEADWDNSQKLIQRFVDYYQEGIPLNQGEKEIFVTLVDILKIRATRWWLKRYSELFDLQSTNVSYVEKFSKHREGFKKTLNNWLANRDTVLDIFSKLKL